MNPQTEQDIRDNTLPTWLDYAGEKLWPVFFLVVLGMAIQDTLSNPGAAMLAAMIAVGVISSLSGWWETKQDEKYYEDEYD